MDVGINSDYTPTQQEHVGYITERELFLLLGTK
jgi:hypothetical protein